MGSGELFWSNLPGGANTVLGNWRISGIVSLHSGQSLTFFSGLDNNGDGNTNDRASALRDFDILENVGGLDPTQFFNPAAVDTEISPTVGGLLGRNTHRGPSFQKLDLAVGKRVELSEYYSLDFRAEFFNLLNHTNLDQPVSVVTSPLFGKITATRNPGRQV